MKFSDIPRFPRAGYEINVGWGYLEGHIRSQTEEVIGTEIAPLELDPDFQRTHVWTVHQQQAYIEYSLKGGETGQVLTFNCPGWGLTDHGPYVIVDGKQRLHAIRRFMNNEITAFGLALNEFEGRFSHHHSVKWRVCSLETHAEVLQLYLNINAGGTPHTPKELDKVREMLLKCTTEK